MRGAPQQFTMLVTTDFLAAFFYNTAHIFLPSRYNLHKNAVALS
jgi:hypothetical protein